MRYANRIIEWTARRVTRRSPAIVLLLLGTLLLAACTDEKTTSPKGAGADSPSTEAVAQLNEELTVS